MAVSDAEMASTTSPLEEIEDDGDLDSWRDSIGFITPNSLGQILALPVGYLIVGVGAGAALFLLSHGRGFTPLGWLALGTAAVFIVWAFALAWNGYRAYGLWNLESSQRFVRMRATGISYLCVLVTAVGIISGSPVLPGLGLVALFMFRSQATTTSHSSEFRISLMRIYQRALLVEGIAMAAISLACGVIAFFVIDNGSHLASEYIGGGAVFFIVGVVVIAVVTSGLLSRVWTKRRSDLSK
jgi:hypothetical protein